LFKILRKLSKFDKMLLNFAIKVDLHLITPFDSFLSLRPFRSCIKYNAMDKNVCQRLISTIELNTASKIFFVLFFQYAKNEF